MTQNFTCAILPKHPQPLSIYQFHTREGLVVVAGTHFIWISIQGSIFLPQAFFLALTSDEQSASRDSLSGNNQVSVYAREFNSSNQMEMDFSLDQMLMQVNCAMWVVSKFGLSYDRIDVNGNWYNWSHDIIHIERI